MHDSNFDSRTLLSAARVTLLAAAALALAACQTDSGSPAAGDVPKAEVAAGKPDVAAPKPQAAKPAEEAEPMTRTRAARENLDKRADIVNKCIEDKMKAAAASPPKT